MPQIAGFRGAVWDASKVELAKVVSARVRGAKDLIASGALVRDPTRTMYRYVQTYDTPVRTHSDHPRLSRAMLVCAVRLAPWTEGSIRAHEATDARARDAALAGISAAGAHTEALFAGYRDAAREVDRLLRGVEDGHPVVDVTTSDGTQHRLWRVPSAETIGKLRTLFAPKKLHVLDGHARYEGMLAFADTLGADAQPQYSSVKYGLASLVNLEDRTLTVGPRHRVVRGDDITRDAVLDRAKQYFIVDKLAGAATDVARQQNALLDNVAHQPACVLVFAGEADAWKLTLKPDTLPTYEGVEVHRALQKYDPIVVDRLLIGKCAPGARVQTEREAPAVHAAVAAGAQLGIVMRPLTLEQVIHADELGALLPFGSTAFGPPLAHLVSFVIDPDEDLV